MSAVDVSSFVASVGGVVVAVGLVGLAVLNLRLLVRAFKWLRVAATGGPVDLAASVKPSGSGAGGGSSGDRVSVGGLAKTAVSGGFFAALLSSCSWF